MGYIKHHSIIITSYFKNDIDRAHAKALELFKDLDVMYENTAKIVSAVYEGIANTQYTFFIAPDGSKEGWSLSNLCNNAREEFRKWLKQECTCDFIEICFGGDDEYISITDNND